jgi:hypothetical protein
MQFGKLQAREAKRWMEAKTFPATQLRPARIPFFRRGSEGSGRMELKPETLSKIRDATQHLFARANESLARQSLRNQAIREEPPPAFSAEAADSRNGHAEVIPASNSVSCSTFRHGYARCFNGSRVHQANCPVAGFCWDCWGGPALFVLQEPGPAPDSFCQRRPLALAWPNAIACPAVSPERGATFWLGGEGPAASPNITMLLMTLFPRWPI